MYLYHKLKQWCQSNGEIRLVCPNYWWVPQLAESSIHTNHSNVSQSAVVKGAALRGLEGTKPRRTYCRFHYGYLAMTEFREGLDDEKDAVIDQFYRTKLCSNRMIWFIKKVSRQLIWIMLQECALQRFALGANNFQGTTTSGTYFLFL